ncbi:hypothetical protein QOT17_005809, partial [Balamuthia mandrillaris]
SEKEAKATFEDKCSSEDDAVVVAGRRQSKKKRRRRRVLKEYSEQRKARKPCADAKEHFL